MSYNKMSAKYMKNELEINEESVDLLSREISPDEVIQSYRKNKGNISKTAEFIGMERSALHRKLKSLGIKGIN